jgi:Family of unknown function (DUF6288)
MKRIIPLLTLALSCLPLPAQVDYNGTFPWSQTTGVAPDSAVPGWFYNLGITGLRVQLDPAAPRTLVVKYVFAGTPAAAAGVQVNDVITGVEGQPFTADHQDGYGVAVFGARGPISEFGIALDNVQGVDGLLGVTLTRGGSTLSVTINVGKVYGSFSPTFPLNCPKSDLILSQLLTYLRQTQKANGAWGQEGGHGNNIFAGLALLSDGSPASMTAAGKLVTYYTNQTNGPIPADGLGNWQYLAASIYLSEYYHKTNDASILTKLNTLYGYLLASQYKNVSQIVGQPHGPNPTVFGFGGWGHNPGCEGYGPIAMTTGQGALAFALMKRVGVDVDRTRLDAAYDYLVKGTGANNYVWYQDSIGGNGPYDWGDPGRTGGAAIANWMSPYAEPAYAARATNYARFMGAHPQSFPDTHASPTIGMAYAAMGAHFDPESFRQLLDNNRWWFSLAQTPEGNFYYQPNRDSNGYAAAPRFVASSVTALILSLPKRNLMISERVVSTDGGFVPNGKFQMYKPGTGYTVTAAFADANSYARGVGDGIVLADGTVNYADGTTGTTVDLPGWTPLQSGNDLTANGVDGSTGMNFFAAWGGDGRIQSASALGTVQDRGVYTISAMVGGPDNGPIQGPLAFHLLADGVQLTPTFSVNPTLPNGGGLQQISRTYQGAALAGHIGAKLTIVLGVENANDAGDRVIFDNVAITGLGVPQASFEFVPKPISPTAISMTATTGTSANGTVQYLFTETSGNPGGSSSGWQISPSYTDSGLTASTRYTYTVTMRDSLANTVNAFVPTAAMSATTQMAGFGEFVPNGNFQMYKPGTGYTVTAAFADESSYASGLGNGIVLASGTVNYADGSTGTTVDLPGWTPLQSSNDLTANGVDGSTGMNFFAAWGGDGRIQSASAVGTVQDGGVYTISAMVGGPDDGPIQGPLAFHLLADGVQLTPTSLVNPTLPNAGGFQQISRTYQGAALTGHIGASLTIVLGVENANDAGDRVIFDNVTIKSATTQIAGFSEWKSANATAQTMDLDHDNDGVPNGIEFFLGGTTSTTGPTTLPGVSKNNGALSITWVKSATYSGIYGIDYRVETSDTLTGIWTPETLGGNVTVSGNDVKYTYPAPLGTRKFTRLRVTGP